MKHRLTKLHNARCLKCNTSESEMVNLQSVVWCEKCFNEELEEMSIVDSSQEELERLHEKWAAIRIENLTKEMEN